MTENTDIPTADEYKGLWHKTLWDEHSRLWQEAVDSLTAAARFELFDTGPLDFTEFLATALQATIANVGDIEHLLSAQPSSWEAQKLAELVRECAGQDRDALIRYRTDPVVVPLNVEELVFDAWNDAGPETRGGLLPPYGEALNEAGDDDEAHDAVTASYTLCYRAYAQRFAAAVLAAAWDVPGLASEQVSVRVEASPEYEISESRVTNPTDMDADWLVRHLWSAALAEVGGPTFPGNAPAL